MRDDETVEVPTWAAREAHQELDIVIERTGGGDTGADEANTPLAEVRDRIRDADIEPRALGAITETIDQVAEERNVDVSGADPLVDRTFQARTAFRDALNQLDERSQEVDDV